LKSASEIGRPAAASSSNKALAFSEIELPIHHLVEGLKESHEVA
jgi:hypothetical protein